MVKLGENLQTHLHDQIVRSTQFETLSISSTSSDKIVATIVNDGKLYNVTARIIGEQSGSGAATRYANVFTVLCAINDSNGVIESGLWKYSVPHPFNSQEYSVTISKSNTNQLSHADVYRNVDYGIIYLASQALTCYDVTFIGYVNN